mmetsp:Transcript_11529/g.21627  ORF Transcript_11529/g.21627 Transcript_11529/m.21627 type:complete len:102 (-) Transcript_11529:2-307(-)
MRSAFLLVSSLANATAFVVVSARNTADRGRPTSEVNASADFPVHVNASLLEILHRHRHRRLRLQDKNVLLSPLVPSLLFPRVAAAPLTWTPCVAMLYSLSR